MPQVAVAMFCGPHDEGDRIPTRRIDHAITLAHQLKAPLFIAGDAFNGAEVHFFQARAWHAGVALVLPAFDPRHCTLADAQTVARIILDQSLDRLARVHLVTDWWHMDRASTMLERELTDIIGRRIPVIRENVFVGSRPDQLVHDNERQGLDDYLAGRYGQRLVIDPLRHRPQPSL